MRFALAVLLGRMVRFVGKFVGRSTTLPGRIALRLDHAFLKKMKFDGKVIAVTGSNGKTTTQNLVAHILRENGYTVINNTEGSNLAAGVATTLLEHCTLKGQVRSDFVVLEVDERFTPIVFSQIPPLMSPRAQSDRAGIRIPAALYASTAEKLSTEAAVDIPNRSRSV